MKKKEQWDECVLLLKSEDGLHTVCSLRSKMR